MLSTLTVTNALGSGPGSLQAEIAAALSGDTIVFSKGIGSTIFTGPAGPSSGSVSQELEINKNLDIEGPGANKLAISGGGGSRVFQVDAGAQVTLSGLTIENGSGTFDPSLSDPNDGKGGGILNFGTLSLSGSTVTQNAATYGGGIFNDTAGILTVLNSSGTHNTGFDLYNLGSWSADSHSKIGTVGP